MQDKIQILTAPIQGAYYFEDVRALQERSIKEEDRWATNIRQLATGLSIGLKLPQNKVHWGDCISVSYSGKSGREKKQSSGELEEIIQTKVATHLPKCLDTSFRRTMKNIKTLELPKSIEYGLSQALLSYFAEKNNCLMTDLLVQEWNLSKNTNSLNLHGSCGNNRYENTDKMIVNELECLPHSQVDQIETQLGTKGEVLENYIEWIIKRIDILKGKSYRPTLHFDLHGAIGKIFNDDLDIIADYLIRLKQTCPDYKLRIESVALKETRTEQIEFYLKLRRLLKSRNAQIELAADEWANTLEDIHAFLTAECVDMIHIKMPDVGGIDQSLEAVLLCQKYGAQSLLGGSCIETEISTRASVHLAMAVHPTEFLVKPGMGIDEGLMLCRNEVERIRAIQI